MIIAKLLLGIFSGLFLHSLRAHLAPLSGSPATHAMTCYVIGITGTYPVAVLLTNESHADEPAWKRFTLAYMLSFATVGVGVALGWILDAGKPEVGA